MESVVREGWEDKKEPYRQQPTRVREGRTKERGRERERLRTEREMEEYETEGKWGKITFFDEIRIKDKLTNV